MKKFILKYLTEEQVTLIFQSFEFYAGGSTIEVKSTDDPQCWVAEANHVGLGFYLRTFNAIAQSKEINGPDLYGWFDNCRFINGLKKDAKIMISKYETGANDCHFMLTDPNGECYTVDMRGKEEEYCPIKFTGLKIPYEKVDIPDTKGKRKLNIGVWEESFRNNPLNVITNHILKSTFVIFFVYAAAFMFLLLGEEAWGAALLPIHKAYTEVCVGVLALYVVKYVVEYFMHNVSREKFQLKIWKKIYIAYKIFNWALFGLLSTTLTFTVILWINEAQADDSTEKVGCTVTEIHFVPGGRRSRGHYELECKLDGSEKTFYYHVGHKHTYNEGDHCTAYCSHGYFGIDFVREVKRNEESTNR